MDRKDSRELARLILHYADGGEIESERKVDEFSQWCFDNDPSWNCDRHQYRIKKRSGETDGIIYRSSGQLISVQPVNAPEEDYDTVKICWKEI